MRVRGVDVDDEQRRLELRRTCQHGAVGGDDEGVAVEDELVLPADQVHVGQHRAGLAGPLLAEGEAHVVLVSLVGRGVQHGEHGRARLAGPGDGAAVLPQVLADGDGHIDAVDGHDERGVAGHEVAGLVEHAVVGEVVLDVAGEDLAVADDGCRVDRCATRSAGRERTVLVEVVEVADEAGDVAVPVGLQAQGQVEHRVAGGLLEGRPQGEVLHGVPGEHELREDDEPGALGRGVGRAGADERGVAGEIPHGRVDLGEGDAERHEATLLRG